MFVGRTQELKNLDKLYTKENFQMVVMYGRRRVGKTTLIMKFLEKKPGIFFTAQEANDKINLNAFSEKIYKFFNIPAGTGSFESWNHAFDFLADKARQQQFVLAFDEFPYAAGANKSLKSILQNCIDHSLKYTKLFLILCGSHVAFMENEVLGYKSPLFGRRTAQIKLNGFDYYDAAKMLEGFSNEDKIKFYSCIGGTPHYLAQIDPDETFEENIKRLYFDISGYLYNEPMMLLQQELREPAMYNSIISAIANGASKVNEISTKIGENPSKVNKYLQVLMHLQIIKKEVPFGENIEKSRRGIYKIADNCYNFWYRFVFSYLQEIESGTGEFIADIEVFTDKLSNFIGKPAFEEICMEYMKRQNSLKNLPFLATSHGTWWGNDTKERKQADIDIVLANRKDYKIIMGECKWKNSLDDIMEIQKLQTKYYLFPEFKEHYYYFFSKIPYSKQALKMENDRTQLISLDMLFKGM